MCACAVTRLHDVCDRMQDRSISVSELRKIKDHYEQMKRLCEAATANGDSVVDRHLSYRKVDNTLAQTMEELQVLEEHRSHLSHLCSNIPDNVQGK